MIKTIKIRGLFHIWQGHQITDEEIYNIKEGRFPIITGHNMIKGYTNQPVVTDLPCITIPSKGVVNRLYLQTQPFDANNTIALIPKDRSEIDLEYFIYTQTEHITNSISSINSNNYLNKAILEDIEIRYPDYPTQIIIREEYEKLSRMREMINDNIRMLIERMNMDVITDGEDVDISDIFHLIPGSDDKMTEIYAYNNPGTIPIYSGASANDGVFRYTNRIDYDFDAYITWSISGKAGTLFLREGPCCLTRDCGIMMPKNEDEINLEWFALTQEKPLQQYAVGQGGIGRLKKVLLNTYPFILPEKTTQDKIVEEYHRIRQLEIKLVELLPEMNVQLQRMIAHPSDT